MPHQLLLFIHVTGVIVWVGGMVFAYFCLRPAAASTLEPPQRLPLWSAAFGRFFLLVRVAVAAILLSGGAMMYLRGFANAPIGWHVMLLLGLVMAAIFLYIDRMLYPKLRSHVEAAQWPQGAAVLNRIRQGVAVNLVLSVCTIAAALSAR
ncbi:CopD family protein [Caenimonas aquaedulcis]|uniref:CopD family protein n=1 Tax=Caenimonas aquaedulcis TaxID=2793270 RepID=A0A931H860_9BURK|nr:CopD family protein [Caenimonas aquaedulcis]MBG9390105.1 CopD family protein [Caenimonas aquaedulcis]